MPKRKRSDTPQSFDEFEEDYDEDDISSNGSRNYNQPPIQRNAANARERARMRVLSSAFCRLKTKLPWVPADTKLSKLDTLRLATIYIQQLRANLSKEENDSELYSCSNISKGQSLVWPFTFQQQLENKHIANVGLNQWLARDSTDIYNMQTALNSNKHNLNTTA